VSTIAGTLRNVDRDLAGILGTVPDPLLDSFRAQMREASVAEERAARRKLERIAFGGCRCGEVTGEAECPWCDGGIPPGLRGAGMVLRQRQRAQGMLDAFRGALAEARSEKAKTAAAIMAEAPRPPNRHERRRARSGRWRR